MTSYYDVACARRCLCTEAVTVSPSMALELSIFLLDRQLTEKAQVRQLSKFCLNYIDETSTMAYRYLVIQPLLIT